MRAQSAAWLATGGSAIALMTSSGPVLFFTFGVLLKPVTHEMGWSRGAASLALTASMMLLGLAAPTIGRLIDRYGARRVLLVDITLFAASFASISMTTRHIAHFIGLYAVCGVLGSGHASPSYSKVVSAWLDTHRGLALGIAAAGVGIGNAFLPQIAARLLALLGWRGAYVALATLVWLVAFPAVALLIREPGPALAHEKSLPAGAPARQLSLAGDETGDALRTREFWMMTIAAFMVVVAVTGATAHLVALLTDEGMKPTVAASMLVAVGLATTGGRLLCGYLLDRLFAPHLAAALFFLAFIGVSLLWTGIASRALGLIAATCLGIGIGVEIDIIGFLVGRYFGLRRYTEIYGYVFFAFTLGAGLGPYVMGLSFDSTGSYRVALSVFCVGLIIASAVMSRLGPYRYSVLPQSSEALRPMDEAT